MANNKWPQHFISLQSSKETQVFILREVFPSRSLLPRLEERVAKTEEAPAEISPVVGAGRNLAKPLGYGMNICV